MSSITTQPLGLSGLSYSSDSTKGLPKRTPKSEAMSWAEFAHHMMNGDSYETINAVSPMSRREYNKRVKAGRYTQDHVRKQAEKIKSICAMYDAKVPVEEIAKTHGLSEQYCKTILYDNKRPCTKFALIIRDQQDKIRQMAEGDYTVKDMAKEFKISPNFMADILAALGLKTKRERIAEFADDLTRSKLTALLEQYGSIRGVSQATGVSMAKLKECAETLKVAIK